MNVLWQKIVFAGMSSCDNGWTFSSFKQHGYEMSTGWVPGKVAITYLGRWKGLVLSTHPFPLFDQTLPKSEIQNQILQKKSDFFRDFQLPEFLFLFWK
jgi:hypothetical protein